MLPLKVNKILVTTTPYLEGWQVKEYFGLITSRVVTGTGIFLDIAASFTDIFGGRSGTYQEQINQITYEVIGLLKEQAFSKGANAIIGTRIDHDEISGKGKQMFMVTATGTAVIANKNKELLANDNLRPVTSKHLEKEMEKIKILNMIKDMGLLNKEDTVWPFITNEQVFEAAPYVIELLKNDQLGQQPNKWFDKAGNSWFDDAADNWLEKACNYFSVIDPDVAKFYLYSGLSNKGIVAKRCLRIIKANSLLDYDLVLPLLESQDFELHKYSLSILVSLKEYFFKKDIAIMERLKQIILSNFPDLGDKNEVKKIWQCKCGKINKEINNYCRSCSKDIKGFIEDEVKPSEALLLLNNKIDALKSIYNI